MIRSMTGYGRGECVSHDRRFKVEIKSVNHRYGDIAIKLPRFLNPLEDRVRKRLSWDIQRGKADVYIAFETYASQDVRVSVNTAMADACLSVLRDLTVRYSLRDEPSLSHLIALPDLIHIEKNTMDDSAQEELWETLSEALENALTQYNTMRAAEGLALYRNLTARRDNLRLMAEELKTRAPAIAAEYAERLRERIMDALSGTDKTPDESRLLTEVAIFTDRASIDEELTRLDSHIAQMGEILEQSDAVGRKLDFLVQELNREANTIGSKSNDVALTRLVVSLKSEIEKIREQVQNIE